MVESTALEMRHTGNRIGGSNPSLSANRLIAAARSRSLTTKKSLYFRHIMPFPFYLRSPKFGHSRSPFVGRFVGRFGGRRCRAPSAS